ncbi:3-deoxy-D-manno-octulosonic acid transferase [Loktanella sp. S4079]|nr:3-deoxy-D-manno-octulosonic acid transferase [Loktanella sp. S4079]
MKRGSLLRIYLAGSYLFPLVAGRILRKRLSKGKEHPTRWTEKQGRNLAPRPKGQLVWLHAVGLGETLSLRGLIARMAAKQPELSFLVTSTTRASAQVFAQNLPPRTIHQFLPIDAPLYRRRFLDHFEPDLCIWAEQDIWPGFVSDLAQRDIPQAIIAARLADKSFKAHQRAKSLYRDLYQAMKLVTAQDATTATHLGQFGVEAAITGSLKPAAPALSHSEAELSQLRAQIAGRFTWVVAPSHPRDEVIACKAHELLLRQLPDALLIIAPRDPKRPEEADPNIPRKSKSQHPKADDPVWLCDTYGDLGLIYRLTDAALIGGTFTDVEGHNPWEAAALNTAILHGPRYGNFTSDFAQLHASNAAISVKTPEDIANALLNADLADLAARASTVVEKASLSTDQLALDLLGLLRTPK